MFCRIRQFYISRGFISEPRGLWPIPVVKGRFHVLHDMVTQLPAFLCTSLLGSAVLGLQQNWMFANMEIFARRNWKQVFFGEE